MIVVVGAAGTEEYEDQFAAWCDTWSQTCRKAEADFTQIGRESSPPRPIWKLCDSCLPPKTTTYRNRCGSCSLVTERSTAGRPSSIFEDQTYPHLN